MLAVSLNVTLSSPSEPRTFKLRSSFHRFEPCCHRCKKRIDRTLYFRAGGYVYRIVAAATFHYQLPEIVPPLSDTELLPEPNEAKIRSTVTEPADKSMSTVSFVAAEF